MNEQWYIYAKKADFAEIGRKFNISPMLARILRNRGLVSDEEIQSFLYAGVREMYDPFLFKDMQKGAELAARCIRGGGKIRIIGDYDCDGVMSTYILQTAISSLGGNVDAALPDRVRDGYGINERMVDEAFAAGVSLIITCDNGIAACNAVAHANNLGIDVIVTDHHEPPEHLPEAFAVIDAKQEDCTYPFREVCGAAVAYKFVQALLTCMDINGEDTKNLLDYLLQFAGFATITDIVPLKDENRIFAREGIRRLRTTTNPGLKALMKEKNMEPGKLSAYHIGFILGPCINSAGRLRNASMALDLLASESEAQAAGLASDLAQLNEERKKLTSEQVDIIEKRIADLLKKNGRLPGVLIFYLPSAHESVAGIIAGRLKEEYCRPAFVLTNSDGTVKGSGRSTDAYNITEEILKYPELFSKIGGHERACGFTLSCSPEEFARRVEGACRLSEEDLVKKIWIDMQLPFSYISEQLIDELSLLEPCGTDNARPLFAHKNVTAVSSRIIGKSSNVLSMKLRDADGCIVDGIMFGSAESVAKEKVFVDREPAFMLTYVPAINEYAGRRSIQIRVISIKKQTT